jgi:hypothetical protein
VQQPCACCDCCWHHDNCAEAAVVSEALLLHFEDSTVLYEDAATDCKDCVGKLYTDCGAAKLVATAVSFA